MDTKTFTSLKQRRIGRFDRAYTGPVDVWLPLLKAIPIEPLSLVMLQSLVGDYLMANIYRYGKPLLSLENVTPGGWVKDYGYCDLERKELDAMVYSMLKPINVSLWATDPIVRVVDGRPDPERASRPYAT